MKQMLLRAGVLCLCSGILPAQDPKELLQQRFGEIKESIAQNQAQLRTYQWNETTELSVKGEVKSRTQRECRFAPDGTLQKTPIGAPPPPQKAPRGVKGKLIANKVDELKNYMDRFGSLMSRYVPPNAAAMQNSFQSGKADLVLSGGGTLTTLIINDYAKPGDRLTIDFDTAAKRLRQFRVSTYLDGPEDAVTVDARFTTLDDGTNYVEDTVLTSKSKQLQINITNFGYRKVGP